MRSLQKQIDTRQIDDYYCVYIFINWECRQLPPNQTNVIFLCLNCATQN